MHIRKTESCNIREYIKGDIDVWNGKGRRVVDYKLEALWLLILFLYILGYSNLICRIYARGTQMLPLVEPYMVIVVHITSFLFDFSMQK